MDFIKFLAGAYIIGFIFLIIFGMFLKIKVGGRYRFLILLFACSAGVYAFAFEPGAGLDLYRLQQYAMDLRFYKGNVIQQIISAESTLSGTSLSGMVSFNLLCYIVRLLGDIHWLSTISVLLTIGIMGSIIVDYVISEGYSSKALGWSFLLSFMGLQMQYVFSGVRNAVAVAYSTLAMYLWFYKKKGIVPSILLIILAATMHPAGIISLIPLFLCRRKEQIIWRVAALLSMPIIFLLPNILRLIPISYFQYLASRISFCENVAFQYDRPEMIANGMVFIAIGLTFWYYCKHNAVAVKGIEHHGSNCRELYRKQIVVTVNKGIEQWYVNTYFILGFVMLGYTIHRDFALRIGYIMGIGAMPLVLKLLFSHNNSSWTCRVIQILLRLTIIICCTKVYYDTALAFLNWNFV